MIDSLKKLTAYNHDGNLMDWTSHVRFGQSIDLGAIVMHPQRRALQGPEGHLQLEPLVMRLLVVLAMRAGRMVDRFTIFETCWPGSPVGDDSLNRLVNIARRALRSVGGESVEIITIPAAGYTLRLRSQASDSGELGSSCNAAVRAAFLSWRAAYPLPNFPVIERLKIAASTRPDRSDCRGMLALMYRHAVEYGPIADRAEMVQSCEDAAGEALAIDPSQPEARIAMAGIVPLFGNWSQAHCALTEILAEHPSHVIATHDLAIVEMATGRVAHAKSLIDPLARADPSAPCFGYKSAYQHWSLGDLETMDHRADQAIQLWPDHPAVWTARFWTLAHTGRLSAALAMVAPGVERPAMSEPVAEFARNLLRWKKDGIGDRSAFVRQAVDAVSAGPAQAINSLMALGLLEDVDAGFEVAQAYYLQEGQVVVPAHGERELPVNEMRRRITQQLFTPACAAMRADPRIAQLCERMGLVKYWTAHQRSPQVPIEGLSRVPRSPQDAGGP